MTQLFPDVDLSRFAAQVTPNYRTPAVPALNQNGGAEPLPPGEPVGVMAGLNSSLLALLANFSPGDLGVCIVDEKLQLSLPLADWGMWSWIEQGDTASITAASSVPINLFEVPTDERAWLDGFWVTRLSGDNTWKQLKITAPADYRAGNGVADLVELVSASTQIYWPNGGQSTTKQLPGPILLEPGSLVRLIPAGAGVAASVGTYAVLLRRTKLVRALAP